MENIVNFDSGKQQKGKLFNWLTIVLLLIIVVMSIYLFNQKNEFGKTIVELKEVSTEKETLTFQYQDLLENYQGLQTNNDSLNQQLVAEQERVKEVMTKLRKVQANNKAEIEKYKKELGTLRDIMKGFIHQIDSLNTLNIQLTEENQEIKQKYQKEQTKVKTLTKDYEQAKTMVEKASVLRAIGVQMTAINEKGKVQKKARKAEKFAISFTLDDNVVAKHGEKSIYIRITDPKDLVLMEQEDNMMDFEGDKIAFSALRIVDYDGTKTPTTVYFKHMGTEELEGGKYKVDIFCEGKLIGSSELDLR